MKKLTFVFLFLIIQVSAFSVETKFISSKGFQNIWLWQLSNTSVLDKEYISLPNQTTQRYSTPHLLWSAEKINNNFYFGTGESAAIIKLSPNNSEEIIYSNANQSLVGGIKPYKNGILAGVSPDSQLIYLDNNNKIVTNISLSNNYIWDIVSTGTDSAYILTGMSAAVYEFKNDILSSPITLSNEEHLIKGLYIDKTLWVLGENGLYQLSNNNFIAIASFNGTASGFTYKNNKFYITLSDSSKNIEDPKKDKIQSSLISVNKNGVTETLFATEGFYFTGIGNFKDFIVVGGDQFGFYAFYDLVTKKTEFANLGVGKIIDIFDDNGKLLLLTSDASGLWQIEDQLASEGSFISEVYDTGNVSQWGEFIANISTPPNTSISFFIQSGVTKDTSLWDNWQPISNGQKITVKDARFIRYKAILKSNNKAKPYVYDINFAYAQHNISPIINNLSIVQSNKNSVLAWNAFDPNNDQMEYDIYLAEDGLQKIKITPTPIPSTNFIINQDLFPSGYKRITVVASDKPSNTSSSYLTAEYNSIPILFDNEGPMIEKINVDKKRKKVSVSVTDNLSYIKGFVAIINGTEELFILPVDKMFDNKTENFVFDIPLEETTFLQISVIDSLNNISSKGLTIIP